MIGRGRRAIALLAAVAWCAAASAATGTPLPNDAARPAAVVGIERFEPSACPIDPPDGVAGTLECGTVAVPRRRDASGTALVGSGELRLPVVVLRRPPRTDARPPVVFLHGGPGGRLFPARGVEQPALGAWALGELARLAPRSDLILFEQRGVTDRPDPVECATTLESALALEPDEALARSLDCVRSWERTSGHAVDEMRPEEYAGDVESVRRALGVERWVLYGSSYGGRVAVELVRTVPDAVHAAVLDSPVAPGRRVDAAVIASMATALGHAFAACENDPECAAAWPRLRRDFPAAVRVLDETPVVLDYSPLARTGTGPIIDFDGRVFVALAAALLGEGTGAGSLPKLVDAAARRDASFLARLMRARDPASGKFRGPASDTELLLRAFADATSPPVAIAYACNERPASVEGPLPDPALARSVRDALPRSEPLDALCRELGTAPLPSADAPARGVRTVPVLTLVGDLDVIANRGDADAIERALPGVRTVTFARAAHGPGMTNDCARGVVTDFLEAPALAVRRTDAPRCADEPPTFARDGAETWRDEPVPASGIVPGVPEGWLVTAPGSTWARYLDEENLLWQAMGAGTPASALDTIASWMRTSGAPHGSRSPPVRRRTGTRTARHVEWMLYELSHDNGRLVRAGLAPIGSRVAIVAAMADADGPNASRLGALVDDAIDRFGYR